MAVTNHPDQILGNLSDKEVSYIIVSFIIASPIVALLLMKSLGML
jgi:hypothetical protein